MLIIFTSCNSVILNHCNRLSCFSALLPFSSMHYHFPPLAEAVRARVCSLSSRKGRRNHVSSTRPSPSLAGSRTPSPAALFVIIRFYRSIGQLLFLLANFITTTFRSTYFPFGMFRVNNRPREGEAGGESYYSYHSYAKKAG